MAYQTKEVSYSVNGLNHIGFMAYDDTLVQPKPGILICHDWTGRNQLAEDKAIELAKLGYVGFALDMYGNGQKGETNEQKMALMMPMMEDRSLLQARVLAAFDTLKQQRQVDDQNIMAMGYCFGGLCVLDLARSGVNVSKVVSFHGLLDAPRRKTAVKIKAKVLALHGYDDPMVPHAMIDEFANEMSAANVDWQLIAYGNTLHAFTNPLAADPALGTVYSAEADRRSWQAALDFFAE